MNSALFSTRPLEWLYSNCSSASFSRLALSLSAIALRNDSTAADTAPSFPVLVLGMVNSLVEGCWLVSSQVCATSLPPARSDHAPDAEARCRFERSDHRNRFRRPPPELPHV